jgi:hypothetical protein
MNKLTKSKSFIVGALAVLCVAVLAVCVLMGKGKTPEFIPDAPVPLAVIDSWTENTAYIAGDSGVCGNTFERPGEAQADYRSVEYPRVVEERGDEVVIDFTDPNPPKAPPPKEPGTNPDNNPTPPQPEPSGTPPVAIPPSNPSPSTPVPGRTNDRGEFYDPVFGWVRPGSVVQTEIDSAGDPNKMVGSMR